MTTTNQFICLRLCLLLLLVSTALILAPEARAADLTAGNETQLISAINTVNSAGAGTHTITLTADINLAAALPALTNTAAAEVILDGDGHTLAGNYAHTILKIDPGVTGRVREVTLTNGYGDSGPDGNQGGAIYNRGRLTVEDARLFQNNAYYGGGIATHGGAGNTADVVLTRVLVEANREEGGGGGGLAAMADGGEVTVAVSQSIFRQNGSFNAGGGIFLDGGGGEARLTVDTTAIVQNSSAGIGAALHIASNGGVAVALLLNTTVAGNDAPFAGGGISIFESEGQAELGLAFVTIGDNSSIAATALYNNGAAITAAASILSAGRDEPACAGYNGAPFALTSAGYNLGDDGSCDLEAATDIPNGEPLIFAAQSVPTPYGETYVQEIGPLSDAQQRVPTGVLGCGTTVAQDQRGEARPVPGDRCDIGAYESAAPLCSPPYTAADETQLDWAVACVNGAGVGAHTITLTADFGLTSQVYFNNPEATELVLDGNGHTLTGSSGSPLVDIEAGTTARVRNVTLTGGEYSVGGAIINSGTLTVEDSTIADNTADFGGGIHSGGDLTVVGSTLRGNSADYGGAIDVSLTFGVTPTVTVQNSIIINNEARINGGGLYLTGPTNITLNNVTIDGNRSPNGTGGLDLLAGGSSRLTAHISNSRIVNNVGYRGGLAVIGGGLAEVTVAGSTVAGNRSTAQGGISESSGGGIYIVAGNGGTNSLTLFNSTLSGNSTGRAGGGLLVVGNGGAAEANVIFSTLAENTSGTGGGGIHTVAANGGTASVRLSASIITNGPGAGPDCARPSGAILSNGFNLAGDGTCFLDQAGDLPASAAGLLLLGLNAPGNTPTHALSADSPALDRVPQGTLGCGTAIATDQRGVARPQPSGGRCDIGAYERQPEETPKFRLFLPLAASR